MIYILILTILLCDGIVCQNCDEIKWDSLETDIFYQLNPTERTSLLTEKVYECNAVRKMKMNKLRLGKDGIDPEIVIKKSERIESDKEDLSSLELKYPDYAMNYFRTGQTRIDRGSANIETPLALLAYLSKLQLRHGVTGSIGEIGVHHGKFFVGLGLLARKNEQLFAADVFDNQKLNIDHSGNGSMTPFVNNLAANGIDTKDVVIVADSSANLPANFTMNHNLKQFRLFSVDGGHTLSLTYNDIILAALNLAPGGIIVVDDIPNLDWWGVLDGVFNIMANAPFTIAPFYIGANKMFFTTPGFHEIYYKALLSMKYDIGADHFVHHTISGWSFVNCKAYHMDKSDAGNLWLKLTHQHQLN